jgi:hypothetical protein
MRHRAESRIFAVIAQIFSDSFFFFAYHALSNIAHGSTHIHEHLREFEAKLEIVLGNEFVAASGRLLYEKPIVGKIVTLSLLNFKLPE